VFLADTNVDFCFSAPVFSLEDTFRFPFAVPFCKRLRDFFERVSLFFFF